MNGLYKKVVAAQYPPISQRYSSEFREIISMMLQPNPNLRPTTDQLLNLPVMLGRIQQLKAFDPNIEACSGLIGLQQDGSGLSNRILNGSPEYLNIPSDSCRPSQSGALLNTIKLPRVLRQLTDRLPKPNYESSLARHPQNDAPTTARRDSTSHNHHHNPNQLLSGAGAKISKSQATSKPPAPLRSPSKKQSQSEKK